MGTGNVAGVYFPVGVALCRLVNQHRRETGLRCAARPPRDRSATSPRCATAATTSPSSSPTPRRRRWRAPASSPRPGRSTALRVGGLALPRAADRRRPCRRRHRRRSRISPASGWRWGTPGSGTRAIADELIAAAGLDARRASPPPRTSRPTGWPTRSAAARSTPSPMRSAIPRSSCRRRPPPATRCWSTWPARPSTRWSRRARTSSRRRSRPGSTAATPRGRDLRRRRDAGHPRRRAGGRGSTRSCGRSSSDLEMLRGLDPALVDLDPEAMVARRPGGAAASRRGALLPRAGVARVVTSAAIPNGCVAGREGV